MCCPRLHHNFFIIWAHHYLMVCRRISDENKILFNERKIQLSSMEQAILVRNMENIGSLITIFGTLNFEHDIKAVINHAKNETFERIKFSKCGMWIRIMNISLVNAELFEASLLLKCQLLFSVKELYVGKSNSFQFRRCCVQVDGLFQYHEIMLFSNFFRFFRRITN